MTKQVYIDISENFNNSFYSVLHRFRVYTNGNNKPLSLICYTQNQFEDMKLHIQSDPSCIINVDRTFNLGPAYVTNFVYKNKKVVKKSSRDQPIFLGPVFFHWDASYFTYNTIFSHVKARLDSNVQCIDITGTWVQDFFVK